MTARRPPISFVNAPAPLCVVGHTALRGGDRILVALGKRTAMRTIFNALSAAAMLVIAALPLHAQPSAIESTLEARKVVRGADGAESFASADVAKPGDVIEYVATYRNTSAETIRDLEATLPIPAHTELIAGSVG